MRAAILSKDKLCLNQLTDNVKTTGIEKVITYSNPQDFLKVAKNAFIKAFIIDLDLLDEAKPKVFLDEFYKARFSELVPTIVIGTTIKPSVQKDIARRSQSETLRKPFTGELFVDKFEGMLTEFWAKEIKSVEQPDPDADAKSHAELLRKWELTVEQLNDKRQEVSTILTAKPNTLRALLEEKAAAIHAANGSPSDQDPALPLELFPLKSVLIVDKDEAVRNLLTEYFKNKGVFQIEVVEDGAQAWEKLKNPGDHLPDGRYDLLVAEWHLEKIDGLTLYSRIRSHEPTKDIPVLIFTMSITADDFRYLGEHACTQILEKPFLENTFSGLLTKIVTDAVVFDEHIDDLLELIEETSDAHMPASQLPCHEDTTFTTAFRMAGDYFFSINDYDRAETAYKIALNKKNSSLYILTQLSKIYYLTKRFKEASDILERSQIISPKNIERLCLLGELNLKTAQPQEAQAYFEKACAIDPEHQKAKAGVTVATGLSSLRQVKRPSATQNLASQLNLAGIHLARNKGASNAEEYYRAALNFTESSLEQAKLLFNLGLAHLRGGDKQKALSCFKECDKIAGGSFEKVHKYIRPAA